MGAGFSRGGGLSKGGAGRPAEQFVSPAMPPGYDPNVHKPSIGVVPGFDQQMAAQQGRQIAQSLPPNVSQQPYQSGLRFAGDQPRSLAENMRLTPMPMVQPFQQSPFGASMSNPRTQPYQPYQMPPNMFGGLAALLPFMRRQY